ncbi:MAG: hypothetical protein QXV17_08860 [Candidatus Micrarchaeaceae archaeon]
MNSRIESITKAAGALVTDRVTKYKEYLEIRRRKRIMTLAIILVAVGLSVGVPYLLFSLGIFPSGVFP